MIRRVQPNFPRIPVFVLCVALAFATTHGRAESVVLVRPHGGNLAFDSQDAAGYFQKASLSEQFFAAGITFNIAYDDIDSGFTDPVTGPALRARLEEVLAYVASIINYKDRTLDVQVETSEFDGSGALATAGTFYSGTPGIHPGSSFQRLESGFKPFILFPEMTIMVDLGFAWNVDSGLPDPDEADFFSVLLHEVTHGLGFASVIDSDGSSALGSDNFTTYDQLLFDPGQNRRVLTEAFPPTVPDGGAALTSGALEFDGAASFSRYGTDMRAPIYSPNPMEAGSSLSHWDVDRILGEAVMTHSIALGTIQREYAPVDLGALEDLGYDNFGVAPGGGCTLGKQVVGMNAGADVGSLATFLVLGAVLIARPRDHGILENTMP